MSITGASSRASRQASATFQNTNETVDWSGLTQKFNELKSYLAEPSLSFSNSSAQRSKQRENVEMGLEAIIEVALSESHMLMRDGDFRGAVQGGLKTLHFVQELYGASSIEQIEPYFLLAKAYQYLKKYKKAEEFLSIAQWTVIKNPEAPAHIRAELEQNFGLLYVSKNNIEKAIEHLSTSIYYLALIHGTDHLITSFGYFNLGNVFASQDRMDAAVDFLKHVTSIWNKNLLEVFDSETRPTQSDQNTQKALDKLDEDKIQEAGRMLQQVLHIFLARFSENHIETGRIFLVLGLYQWYVGEMVRAREFLEKAANIFEYVLGDQNASTREVRSIIAQIIQ